jgi:cytochrome c biogenesis protein CcmG/thiol:disulfide interchange protein DsbE
MKKTFLVVVTLAALLGVTYWADRRWPAGAKPGSKAAAAPSASVVPAVVLKDLEGRDVTLEQYKGKVVLVNFWATWCEPCRIEIPWMIEFQQKYGPRGFTMLGIAMDDEGKKVVEPFVRQQRFDVNGQQMAMNYPIVLGNDDIAEKFGGLIGLPTSMLISRDGKKVKTIIGLVNHDDIVKAIESQL